ncbi:MAG: CoA transferase [Alphaproteobacteria bacterium]|nr:CoA transferase [Alphaproteobacteria bacterium]
MALPLDGVLVVSIEQAVAAPYASMRLADAGARVIKVERPEGDFGRYYDKVVNGSCSYFVSLNRGKESITLDFKNPSDATLLATMVARADVFIQNLAPGAAERVGFGSAALRAKHPRLITCDISGYGETGPYAEMKAYDFLVQCETGLVSVTGTAEERARVGISIGDLGAGLNAYAGVLEALALRERTGRGSGVAVSLFDALADLLNHPFLHQTYAGRPPVRAGLSHPTIAPYGAYRVGDGREIVIAIQNEREFARFCAELLGNEALARDARFSNHTARVANRPALDALIVAAFSKFDIEGLSIRLNEAGIAFGRLNGIDGLAAHPQLRRMTITDERGPVELIAPPVRFSEPRPAPSPVPGLGQHAAAIRAEFSKAE